MSGENENVRGETEKNMERKKKKKKKKKAKHASMYSLCTGTYINGLRCKGTRLHQPGTRRRGENHLLGQRVLLLIRIRIICQKLNSSSLERQLQLQPPGWKSNFSHHFCDVFIRIHIQIPTPIHTLAGTPISISISISACTRTTTHFYMDIYTSICIAI
jgi:hypothetical protein